jgi:hypothetical protein
MTHKLVCARQFNPALFMCESWSAAAEDERAERLAEVDVCAITLVSCLKKDDELPTGEHCVRMFASAAAPSSAYGNTKAPFRRNWKAPLTFVFFDGLILRHRNGNRYSLYLSWHDAHWHWYSGWLGNTRSGNSPSAVLAA